MTTDSTSSDRIPLAAAAVALGTTPSSATVLASRGKFPVTVRKQGRYNVVDRAEVLAVLKRRPHLTKAQYKAILKAHETPREVSVSPAGSGESVVELLSGRQWISTAEVAQILGVAPAVVNARHADGRLPFTLEPDPESPRGGRRAASLEVAAYLAEQEPSWPAAEEFAAVPSLDLAEVKQALGDDAPAGADDPTTQAYLRSRETISMADYALMLGIPQDTLKIRIQREAKAVMEGKTPRAQIETVEVETPTETKRKLRRIRSDFAAAELRKESQAI